MTRYVSFYISISEKAGYGSISISDLAYFSRRWPRFCKQEKEGLFIENEQFDSPDFQSFLLDLKKAGARFRFSNLGLDREAQEVHAFRKFSAKEMSEAELFSFSNPIQRICEADSYALYDETRVIMSTLTKREIGYATPLGRTLCRQALRLRLEKEQFIGLQFCEVTYKGKKLENDSLYRLGSSVTVEPMLNSLVTNTDGVAASGDRTDVTLEDCFLPWIFRYSRRRLKEIGNFDFARTQTFGANCFGFPGSHCFIVSRKFKEFIDKNKIKIRWAPVELVD